MYRSHKLVLTPMAGANLNPRLGVHLSGGHPPLYPAAREHLAQQISIADGVTAADARLQISAFRSMLLPSEHGPEPE